jgi:hypothetical protein
MPAHPRLAFDRDAPAVPEPPAAPAHRGSGRRGRVAPGHCRGHCGVHRHGMIAAGLAWPALARRMP